MIENPTEADKKFVSITKDIADLLTQTLVGNPHVLLFQLNKDGVQFNGIISSLDDVSKTIAVLEDYVKVLKMQLQAAEKEAQEGSKH